ncbi:MAG: PEP-CTERM sorting domain-containing protein, partial [Okeania sp. SIO3B3]|nr:PEP-CTERM sorting domain-containing protein [Okeania sp. SIO3B3]
RADVTSQVASKVGTGGGTFSFTVDSENPNNFIDGEILAVVYSSTDPLEEERTIAFLDGFSSSGGDTTTVNLSQPLDITTPNFGALLSLGIGYSYQRFATPQFSTVDVDGRRLTSSAGGEDDGVSGNGGLITVGGLGDSTANPSDPFANPTSSSSDDELYNLAVGNSTNPAPFLTQGATSFRIDTENPSFNDNLFFLGINITAEANINEPISVPEPSTIIGLLAIGFGGSLLKKKVHKA